MIAQNGSWTLTFTSHFTQVFGVPSIDLFASRLNMVHLLLMPFLLVGGNIFFFYILIDRVLQKVEADETSGILIVPQWTTQRQFPVLMGLLVREPLVLRREKNVLQMPYNRSHIHPLHQRLTLMACKLSGCHYKVKDFQSRLLKLSCHHQGASSTEKQYKTYLSRWH